MFEARGNKQEARGNKQETRNKNRKLRIVNHELKFKHYHNVILNWFQYHTRIIQQNTANTFSNKRK